MFTFGLLLFLIAWPTLAAGANKDSAFFAVLGLFELGLSVLLMLIGIIIWIFTWF